MKREVLESLLSELFPKTKIPDFLISDLLENEATEESIRDTYETLRS